MAYGDGVDDLTDSSDLAGSIRRLPRSIGRTIRDITRPPRQPWDEQLDASDVQPPPAPSAQPATVAPSAPATAAPTPAPSAPFPTTLPGSAPPAPGQPPMAATVGNIGAQAATPSPLGPVLAHNRWALTQPPGNYQQVPSYGQAASDVAAGVPGTGKGLTKLGKVLAILQSFGQGAMVGSTQPTFGTGALASNQFENQQIATQQEQQQRGMGLEQQRQNLAMMPLYRAMQMEQMRAMQSYRESQEDLNRAKTERQRQLAGQVGKPFQSGDRMLVYNPDSPNADENGYMDVGPAKTAAVKPEKVSPEQETFDYYTRPAAQGGLGKSPAQAFAAMHPHEWQQTPGAGAGGAAPPASPELQEKINSLSPALRERFTRLDPQTQDALFKLASGDLPRDTWSARGTYKNIGGLTQAQAVGWASAINPGWNSQLAQTKQRVMNDYVGTRPGTAGAQIGAFNTFLNHTSDARDAVDSIQETRSPLLNRPLNWLRKNAWGDPAVQQYWAALEPVRKEFMSVLNAGRAESQSDQQEMEKVLDDNASPAQIRGVLKTLGHAAVRRLDALNEDFRTATGGQDFPNLIYPEAKQSAEHIGLGKEVSKYKSGGFMPGYAAPAAPAAQPAAAGTGGQGKKSKASQYGVEF